MISNVQVHTPNYQIKKQWLEDVQPAIIYGYILNELMPGEKLVVNFHQNSGNFSIVFNTSSQLRGVVRKSVQANSNYLFGDQLNFYKIAQAAVEVRMNML